MTEVQQLISLPVLKSDRAVTPFSFLFEAEKIMTT